MSAVSRYFHTLESFEVNECELDYAHTHHIAEVGNAATSLLLSIMCLCLYRLEISNKKSVVRFDKPLMLCGTYCGIASAIFHSYPSKWTLAFDHLGVVFFALAVIFRRRNIPIESPRSLLFVFSCVMAVFVHPLVSVATYLPLLGIVFFLEVAQSLIDSLVAVLGVTCLVVEGGLHYCPLKGLFTLHTIWHLSTMWLFARLSVNVNDNYTLPNAASAISKSSRKSPKVTKTETPKVQTVSRGTDTPRSKGSSRNTSFDEILPVNGIFKCPMCDKEYVSEMWFKRHLNSKH